MILRDLFNTPPVEEALYKGWVQPQPTTFRQVVRWLAAPDDIRRAAATHLGVAAAIVATTDGRLTAK